MEFDAFDRRMLATLRIATGDRPRVAIEGEVIEVEHSDARLRVRGTRIDGKSLPAGLGGRPARRARRLIGPDGTP